MKRIISATTITSRDSVMHTIDNASQILNKILSLPYDSNGGDVINRYLLSEDRGVLEDAQKRLTRAYLLMEKEK
jgi:hypothetical protein